MKKNTHNKHISIMSYASCYGAQDHRCHSGPITLKNLQLTEKLQNLGYNVKWAPVINPTHPPTSTKDSLAVITNNCKTLADQSQQAKQYNKKIIVIGGDHACAIGTWSGIHSAMHPEDFGLIWIDAHMDSHTTSSSPSGAIHGMPIAALLGYGEKTLCDIESSNKKLQPRNLCLIGIRSFENAEKKLLEKLNVKIFYMEDVQKMGLETVLHSAKQHVTKHCNHFGLSIDLDAIDPIDAPGVGSREKNGLSGRELIVALKKCNLNGDNLNNKTKQQFIGIEIAELNTDKDSKNKTAKLAIDIIVASFE